MRFLDHLIHEPVRSVVLHRAGASVLIPLPERYAIYKLIVATWLKQNLTKQGKDIDQAKTLIEALKFRGFKQELQQAWDDAWNRGAAWREALGQFEELL